MASSAAPPEDSGLIYPLPPTSQSPGEVFAVYATTTIAAPPATVLDAVLDYGSYGKWNTFVPHVTITSQPAHASSTGPQDTTRLGAGSRFNFSVFMDGYDFSSSTAPTAGRQTALVLTVIEELKDGRRGFEVRWSAAGLPYWLLHSERVHEIVESGEGGATRYSSKETFGGWLGWFVMWFVGGKLVLRFRDWGVDLKGYVEGLKRGE